MEVLINGNSMKYQGNIIREGACSGSRINDDGGFPLLPVIDNPALETAIHITNNNPHTCQLVSLRACNLQIS